MKVRTEDGMTNGAGNEVKTGVITWERQTIWYNMGTVWSCWLGEKTRHDNKHLYIQGIQSTWTPIKPITIQFAVGRNRTAQVVRKQFP